MTLDCDAPVERSYFFPLSLSCSNPTIQIVIEALLQSEGRLTELEAARMIFRSVRRFRAIFLRETGMNFRAFRLRVKLEIAQSLLRNTRLPVHAIAERLQYASTKKFVRSFRKLFGMTPTQYRWLAAGETVVSKNGRSGPSTGRVDTAIVRTELQPV